MSKTYSYTRVTTHSNGALPPKSPPEEPPVYSPVYSSVFRSPLRSSSSTINTAGLGGSRGSGGPPPSLSSHGSSHLHRGAFLGGHGDERTADLLAQPPPPPLVEHSEGMEDTTCCAKNGRCLLLFEKQSERRKIKEQ